MEYSKGLELEPERSEELNVEVEFTQFVYYEIIESIEDRMEK